MTADSSGATKSSSVKDNFNALGRDGAVLSDDAMEVEVMEIGGGTGFTLPLPLPLPLPSLLPELVEGPPETPASSVNGIAVRGVTLRGRSESDRRRRIISAETRQRGDAESGGRGGVRAEEDDMLEPLEAGVVGSDLERLREATSSTWSSSIDASLLQKAFSQARRSSH